MTTKPAKVGLQLLGAICLFSSCVALGAESAYPSGILIVVGIGLMLAGSPR